MPDSWGSFQIRDSYHPAPQWILDRLHGDKVLQGRILQRLRNLPEPGKKQDAGEYYALEVDGIPGLVLVPVHKVKQPVIDAVR